MTIVEENNTTPMKQENTQSLPQKKKKKKKSYKSLMKSIMKSKLTDEERVQKQKAKLDATLVEVQFKKVDVI
jgi:hypothetical protein